MISGADLFCRRPSWYLGSQRMENSTELDVLGIILTNDGKSEKHVNKRIQKCRQAFYSMSSSGMSYPGLPTDTPVEDSLLSYTSVRHGSCFYVKNSL